MRLKHRFFSCWQNLLGLILVLFFIIISILAPLISPNNSGESGPIKIVGKAQDPFPQPPGPNAPLGTLPGNISISHALVWGTRSALGFGLTVSVISAFMGSIIGSISAYFGGLLNKFLMWFSNSFMTLPIIAAIVLVQQLINISLDNLGVRFDPFGNMYFINEAGNPEIFDEIPAIVNNLLKINPLMIAFILFSWMPYARIMNSIVLSIKKSDYVMAARASGAKNGRIILRHLLPNAISPIIVLAAKDIGGFVVLQSTFAFIGFGKGSPWAMILVQGRDWIYAPKLSYWWVFIPACVVLILFGIGWNLLGDGLNDALNPKMPD